MVQYSTVQYSAVQYSTLLFQVNCTAIFKTNPTDRGMCCTFNARAAEDIYRYEIQLGKEGGFKLGTREVVNYKEFLIGIVKWECVKNQQIFWLQTFLVLFDNILFLPRIGNCHPQIDKRRLRLINIVIKGNHVLEISSSASEDERQQLFRRNQYANGVRHRGRTHARNRLIYRYGQS